MNAKNFNHWTILLLVFSVAETFAAARGADTATAKAVPIGTLTKHTFSQSKVFPGTTRNYWVYVPAQYDGSKPACVHVEQDGVQFNMPAIFDQLIASGEMPVTIGVFVQPGVAEGILDQGPRSLQPQLRVRRPGRQLRPVPPR